MRESGDSEPDDAARHAALAVPSRRRLLDLLRAAGQPLDVDELAAEVGLHLTTARHHLHALERVGLVQRSGQRVRGPGRPRQLYTATSPAAEDTSSRKLADVLAAALSWDADAGRSRAERAGRLWAEQEIPETSVHSVADAIRTTQGLFDDLGFAPRLVDAGTDQHIELWACPFRDVARAHPETVCTVHLGLLRGTLERLGTPELRADLRPFVQPELCIADVAAPDTPRERQDPCV